MMRRDWTTSGNREWITPGTALAFSVLMAWLGPAYAHWYGDGLPGFTRAFLDGYAWWIAISFAALSLTAVGEQFPLAARWPAAWRALDVALSLASILVIACGLIALFLPLIIKPMPG
jgi:hypothetical protein